MKRILALILALALSLTIFAGCSPSEPTPPTSDSATTGTPTGAEELEGEITFWHSFTQGGRLDEIQRAADDFMADHPKTKITIETFSWGDFYTKWTTGLAAGNVPDMSTALPNHVVEMIEFDAIVPLDGFIDDIGRDRFYEAPLTEMTKDGECYAVPLYSHAQVMWYHADVLEKYNIEVPQTWDDLYIAAKTITDGENGERYGCSVPVGTNDMLGTRYLNFYVRSAGETLITADGKANLTSDAAIEGIEFWTKMFNDCSPADAINYNVLDHATLYYTGKNVFDFNSGFQIGGVQTNAPELIDNVRSAPMPSINADDEIRGYETSNIPLVVWENSEHPEICEAFMAYLYQPEYYVPFLQSVPAGMLPALKEIATNEEFLSDPTIQKFEESMQHIATAISTGTAIGMENGPVAEAGLLTSQKVIENMFQEIILTDVPVLEAAQAAEDTLNELFETVN